MVIKPTTSMPGKSLAAVIKSTVSIGSSPDFVVSPATLTWTKTLQTLPFATAALFNVSARVHRSSE
jgi:hypothetical protein